MIDINKYIGIPFSKCNCFDLVIQFYKNEFGIVVADPNIKANDTRNIFSKYVLEIQKNWKTITEPKNYCIVAIANDQTIPNTVQHFGIYLDIGEGKILHSLQKIGSHIADIKYYKSAIKAFHEHCHIQ
jgi:hypothetical protein